MRTHPRTMLAALAVLMAALAAPAAAQETQDTTKLPEALRTARTALSAAYAKLDGPAVAVHFADSGAVDFQGQTISGKQAVGGWFTQMFTTLSGLSPSAPTFVVKDDEVSERSGYVVHLPDGSQQAGSSETVWKRQADGSWKVTRLIIM